MLELASRLIDKPAGVTAAGTVLTGIISQAAHLLHLASLALGGMAAVTGTGNIVQSVRTERQNRQIKAEQNRLYFYDGAHGQFAKLN